MKVEERLKELGLELPPPPRPVANYVPAVQIGNLVFVSGHGPRRAGTPAYMGKLGRELTTPQGYEAARSVMLNILATLKSVLGDLDRIQQVVKLLGMVNCTEDFREQPQVINGASDLLVALYGERGRHARSAVGMQSLPGDADGSIPVEIELIVAVT
jgi:enamine deaminase RidA (YjgF/YER057c/UK114 family)